MEPITIGSTYFFKDIERFNSKDIDLLYLVDNPVNFKYMRQSTYTDMCVFEIARLPKEVLIEKALQTKTPMLLNRFLIPEFCKEINFTIEDLKILSPLCDRMDDKHKYLNIIYDAYMENNSFTLSDEQRLKAYDEYLKYRKTK